MIIKFFSVMQHHGICRSAMLLPSRQFGKNVSSVYCLDYLCNASQHQNPAECELALVSALNTFIQNSLIKMYVKCSSICDARFLFEACPTLDPTSCNIMVYGYVKAGQLDDARQLFDIMPGKGCVSYTTMIKGLVQNDCFGEALEVFKNMVSDGVLPNDLTLMHVISACSRFGEIWNCRMIHALAIKLFVEGSIIFWTNLMHAYCLCSSVLEARRLFDKMPERNLVTWNVMLNGYSKTGLVDMAKELFERIPDKDVISWGTMMDGYTQLDCVRKALTMYRAMLRTGAGPNEVMIVNLISACGRQNAIDDGRQLHGTVIKKGFDYNEFLQTTIIYFYAACGMMDLASLQFDVGVKDYLESWNALIAGFIRNGMTDQARQVFDEMPERDVFSWSAMISGYARTEQPKMTLEVFHKMVASGIKPNEVTMIRDEISSVSPWNAILCGLASHGYASMCLEVFSDLLRDHIRPNSNTFVGVLRACCYAGLVGPGRRIFKSMKSTYNVEPDFKHYGCMVDLFGRAGLFEEADEIIRSMPMRPIL